MINANTQHKNPASGEALAGHMKPPKKGTSFMEDTPNPPPMQIGNSQLILFPNEAQARAATIVKVLQHQYGILPYHAKLVAEFQGYDQEGAL